MTDLSPAALRSLAALKARDALDPGTKARLRARIDASIEAGDEVPIDPVRAATAEPGPLDARAVAIRIALPVAIAAALLLGLWAIAPRGDATRAVHDGAGQAAYEARPRQEGTASPTDTHGPTSGAHPVVVATPATAADDAATPDPDADRHDESGGEPEGEDAAPLRSPAAPRTPGRDGKRPPPEPAASDTTLAQEMRLLKAARTALRDGDASGALATLKTHAEAFAHGQMVEDRDALRVEALCAAARPADARKAAAAFARAWPSSPHAARVQKICVTE